MDQLTVHKKISQLQQHLVMVPLTERDLKKIFPEKLWNKLHLQIIFYGREYCEARSCFGIECKICKTCYPTRKKPIKTKKA